jgi:hypothetical protein
MCPLDELPARVQNLLGSNFTLLMPDMESQPPGSDESEASSGDDVYVPLPCGFCDGWEDAWLDLDESESSVLEDD